MVGRENSVFDQQWHQLFGQYLFRIAWVIKKLCERLVDFRYFFIHYSMYNMRLQKTYMTFHKENHLKKNIKSMNNVK